MTDRAEWGWRIEPFASRLGFYLYISEPNDDDGPRGHIRLIEGPNGGPYLCFGTQARAIRKAKRIARRKTRRDARSERLSAVSTNAGSGAIEADASGRFGPL